MPIAVDICNTLADINGQLERKIQGYRNDVYPFPLPENYFTSPIGLCVFRDAKPFPETAGILRSMSRVFGGITYVTSRPQEAEFVTRRWLTKNGFPEGEIVFCQGEEKLSVYSRLKPFLIIEDDPQTLEAAITTNLNIPIIVPQWPYNSHIKGAGIIPVFWTRANIAEMVVGQCR